MIGEGVLKLLDSQKFIMDKIISAKEQSDDFES